jgi:hypothetical protein
LSSPNHRGFSNIPELIDFVEANIEALSLPVGIKATIGK